MKNPRQLSVRAANCLRCFLDIKLKPGEDISVLAPIAASTSDTEFRQWPGIGRVVLAEIRQWHTALGYRATGSVFDQHSIQAAIELLEGLGYTVRPPKTKKAPNVKFSRRQRIDGFGPE